MLEGKIGFDLIFEFHTCFRRHSNQTKMNFKARSLPALTIILFVVLGFCESFNITILHTNDVHSHFVQFNEHGNRCTEKLAKENQCYGGFARQVSKAKEIKSKEQNVLYLNGGDFFQGTVWYTLHRWHIVADMVNQLMIDAMSLGNHEFDDSLKGLFPYLKNLKPTVVVCNINSTKVPEFGELVKPSTVVEVGGEKIGIIGYLTPETKFLSSVGDLEFEDEVECIKREAERLTKEEGLTKIIAVGHSGFAVDQNIAKNVPEVDVVVGGHTNTFLYTGDPPSVEVPQGTYPVVVEREDGSRALVVQDFAFGKYLGYLQVLFDDEGKVVDWSGNPILLDASTPEDPETLELLQPYAEDVKRRSRQTVGQTNVLLRGERLICRMRECNLGNFLADASLSNFIEKPTEEGWNFVAVALWNSGGIRASIDERINEGNITLEDILAVAPFGNTMDVVALKGKHLRDVLEYAVKDYDLDAYDPPGSLLQVSGLRLTYNVSEPVGSRLREVYVRCANCRVPKFQPLDDESVYHVVMNTYMAKGGDGFDLIQKNALSNRNTDDLDVDIITKYTGKFSPVITGLEGRITILSSRDPTGEKTEAERSDTAGKYDVSILWTTERFELNATTISNVEEEISAGQEYVEERIALTVKTDDIISTLETELLSPTETGSSTSSSIGEEIAAGLEYVGERLASDVEDIGEKVISGVPNIFGRRR